MILAILQARMSSTRFPGKVLKPIWGIPMLLFMVNRVQESRWIKNNIVVATSDDKSDVVIWELCSNHDIKCFKGSLTDVLDRFHHVAEIWKPMHIVRLTADCPLMDGELIDRVIDYHLRGGYDYTNNPGYPDGLDVEVITFDALHKTWRDAITPEDREHVCLYIKNNPDLFKIGHYENVTDMSHIKISVDTPEDYAKVKSLVEDSLKFVKGYC